MKRRTQAQLDIDANKLAELWVMQYSKQAPKLLRLAARKAKTILNGSK